jgi:hypothetical protein
MAHSFSHRLPVLIVASAAASALAAAPALATEGTTAPPPVPAAPAPVPGVVPPVLFPSLLPSTVPTARVLPARVITGARLIPRRVRRGHRPLLKIRLTTPSRLRIVVSRRAGAGRIHTSTIRVPVRGSKVSLRLPARSHGHKLRRGRYRVRIVAFDALGTRSLPVRRRLVVRRAHR